MAKTLSLVRAAESLSLSPSAISKQLKEIERFVGCALFERSTREVNLTEQGRAFVATLDQALAQIEEATLALRTKRTHNMHLEVAVSPTFCNRWLIPRLATFYSTFPAATINLQLIAGKHDLHALRADCSIGFTAAGDDESRGERVLPLNLLCVASPSLTGKRRKLDWKTLLLEKPLLGQASLPNAWRDYFAAVGLEPGSGIEGARYQLLSMGHQACLVGLGIALLPDYVVRDDVKAGRLVQLHPTVWNAVGAYRLNATERARQSAGFKAFRQWLFDEVQKGS